MMEQLTTQQRDAAARQFLCLLCVHLSRHTGERRDLPNTQEDDPLFWDTATYPKTVELLRDLVDEYC